MATQKLTGDNLERFLSNARYIYKSFPDRPGYDAFNKKYGHHYSAFPIGKNSFINIFRNNKEIHSLTQKTAIEIINLLSPFIKTKLTGNDDHRLNAFLQFNFAEDSSPVNIDTSSVDRHFYKFLQDYYVYYPSKAPDLLYTGMLSLYKENSNLHAYLVCYIKDYEILKSNEITTLLSEYKKTESVYHSTFFSKKYQNSEGNSPSPLYRLYKSEEFIYNESYVYIRMKNVFGQQGFISLYLDISSVYSSSNCYQCGYGVITHHSSQALYDVTNIALIRAVNDDSSPTLLKDAKGNRHKKIDPAIYEKPIHPSAINKYMEKAFHAKKNSYVFNYTAQETADFYHWYIANKRTLSFSEIESSISKDTIDQLIEKLQQIKEQL